MLGFPGMKSVTLIISTSFFTFKKKKKKKKKKEDEEEKNPPPTFLQHSYNSNDYLESQMYLCTQLSEH